MVQFGKRLAAVETGHDEIEHDHVRSIRTGTLEPFLRGRGFDDLERRHRQALTDQIPGHRLVVDGENANGRPRPRLQVVDRFDHRAPIDRLYQVRVGAERETFLLMRDGADDNDWYVPAPLITLEPEQKLPRFLTSEDEVQDDGDGIAHAQRFIGVGPGIGGVDLKW